MKKPIIVDQPDLPPKDLAWQILTDYIRRHNKEIVVPMEKSIVEGYDTFYISLRVTTSEQVAHQWDKEQE